LPLSCVVVYVSMFCEKVMAMEVGQTQEEVTNFSDWTAWWRVRKASAEGMTLGERIVARGQGLQFGETWVRAVSARLSGQLKSGESGRTDSQSISSIEQELGAIMRAIVYDEDDDDLVETAMRQACLALRQDREVVLEAMRQRGLALEFASPELQADKGVVLEAVKENGAALAYAGVEHQADKGIVLEAVRTNGFALQHAMHALQSDKDVVRVAVKQKGRALLYASDVLRADKEIVLEAVGELGWALQFASDELRSDEEVVLKAIQTSGLALQYASEALRADRNIVLQVVKTCGLSLEFANAFLQADRSVVLEAVKRHGEALQHAHASFQGDKEVVLEAVCNDTSAAVFARQDIFSDEDFVLALVERRCWLAWNFLSESLKKDKDFMLEATKRDGFALQYASDKLRADREVVIQAVRERGGSLRHASDELRGDQDLVVLASRFVHTAYDHEFVSYCKAKAGINDEESFLNAVASAIAIQGEQEPVLSVALTCEDKEQQQNEVQVDGADADAVIDGKAYRCQVSLLSGASFDCEILGSGDDAQRPCPTINDLATKLVEELPRRTEVKTAKRVFITIALATSTSDTSSPEDDNNIKNNDGSEHIAISPWDCDRPLSDFCAFSVGPHPKP